MIRKKMYLYPNDKFNEPYYELINKENKLLETIKVPGRFRFGSNLQNRLPKSNYENNSLVKVESPRNNSLKLTKNRSE